MITDLQPYPAYKNSHAPWLGRVPQHWAVQRLGSLLKERGETNDKGAVTDVLSVVKGRGVIPYSEKGNIGNKASEDIARYKIVRPGDIVANSMNVIIGSVGLSRYTGCLSPVYYVLAKRDPLDKEGYLNAYFQTRPFQQSLIRIGNGILAHRMRIPMELLKCEPFPRPPQDEQAAIVRFLGHANGRIDRFILAKKKMIALLNEQKQAIIDRAVTRGLDPSVCLKPSGISWLGEIPKHWETRRLKQCITPVEQGWSPQCDAQPAEDEEWGVLKAGCVNGDHFNAAQNKKLPSSLAPDLALEIRDGDILVSRANTRELLGLAALADKPRRKLILCDKLFRFRALPENFISRFLVYALRTKPSRAQIESSTNGASSSMQNIGQGVLKNLWVAIPPIEEQIGIVAGILEQTRDLEVATRCSQQEIGLIQEYRTRLTVDVVTGKLDVRDAAANLPTEVDGDLMTEQGGLGDLEEEAADEEMEELSEEIDA